MKDGPNIECEIKIPVDDLEAVRQRLHEAGWRCVQKEQPELNTLVDTDDGSLRKAGRALRLRQYGDRAILTLKGPVNYEESVKIREELEVEVGDLETMARILENLHLLPVVRYEKHREIWRLSQVAVTLDRTPMGHFVEVEGPKSALHAAAQELGLDPSRGVRGSYLDLWQQHRLEHPEDELPHDMIFAP